LDPEWGDGEESVVVSRLREAGTIIVGKTTTMEFATGSPDPSKPFPIPRNPWDPAMYAGRSSSGSASGVAAGLFLGAVGTDTAASIRWPSAFCGVSGIKPTFGLVPKSRLVPLGFSLDHVGPIGRTADDCALMLQAMAGHHAADPDSVRGADFVAMSAREQTDLSGLRIGVVPMLDVAAEHRDPAVTTAFDRAVDVLEHLGATARPVDLPHYQETATATMVTLISEGGAYHAQNLRERWDAYGRGTKGVLGLAPFISGVDYVQAQRVRRVARLSLRELFRSVDVVAMPTAGIAAVPVEQVDDVALGPKWPAMYTPYWNAVGNPAMSVPMGFNAHGLPLGLQLVAAPFRDAEILRTASAFQSATEWHERRPAPLDVGVTELEGG
jgi:aspartyl-tRNA(Asn)/glutamyl-tRNA(Gln) amidotransferase subunit A